MAVIPPALLPSAQLEVHFPICLSDMRPVGPDTKLCFVSIFLLESYKKEHLRC